MSKTFYNIDDKIKEELNEYYRLMTIDFTIDNEVYELLDQYPKFRNYEIHSAEYFTDKVCIWNNFGDYCETSIDELISTIDDDYLRNTVLSCFDYGRYYESIFSSHDINELSNGVIVEILN